MNPLAIKARIAQLRSLGKVAEPHTWISATSLIKNGVKYTYYRLLKGFRVKSHKNGEQSQNKKLKTKMVQYLGTVHSEAYKKLVNSRGFYEKHKSKTNNNPIHERGISLKY
ncbi:hypothetical protein [Crocosphaera chwakensis]|uniref:Uncharacterized protein n=1 Tax=Crocosphaera chwakensis CCY0110 TaxID=391612 RepID=A3ITV6_9CHRO|nr:hypothetical protein [Crocosphaera chwakensis]EAZ90051.1 hypothetical protein CY0110_14935 [Crocosphaera chwakensis CCY0110]